MEVGWTERERDGGNKGVGRERTRERQGHTERQKDNNDLQIQNKLLNTVIA